MPVKAKAGSDEIHIVTIDKGSFKTAIVGTRPLIFNRMAETREVGCRGMAVQERRGEAWLGQARPGMARQGGRGMAPAGLGVTWPGLARRGEARPGEAVEEWSGAARCGGAVEARHVTAWFGVAVKV